MYPNMRSFKPHKQSMTFISTLTQFYTGIERNRHTLQMRQISYLMHYLFYRVSMVMRRKLGLKAILLN